MYSVFFHSFRARLSDSIAAMSSPVKYELTGLPNSLFLNFENESDDNYRSRCRRRIKTSATDYHIIICNFVKSVAIHFNINTRRLATWQRNNWSCAKLTLEISWLNSYRGFKVISVGDSAEPKENYGAEFVSLGVLVIVPSERFRIFCFQWPSSNCFFCRLIRKLTNKRCLTRLCRYHRS